MQLIFAEKLGSQDFTIRAAPGLSGPSNTCGMQYSDILFSARKY